MIASDLLANLNIKKIYGTQYKLSFMLQLDNREEDLTDENEIDGKKTLKIYLLLLIIA